MPRGGAFSSRVAAVTAPAAPAAATEQQQEAPVKSVANGTAASARPPSGGRPSSPPAASAPSRAPRRKSKKGGSRLAKVLYINMDRRADRARAQEQSLAEAGLADIGQRVSAVDGRLLDLDGISTEILTEAGRKQAQNPPDFVLGRVLTPGAVGLWLTWHQLLERTMAEASENECYLVVEDDAEYCKDFEPSLERVIDALDAADPHWEACAVGFIRSKSRGMPLSQCCPEPRPSGVAADDIIGRPLKLCGASAILVRGAPGAAGLLEELFPVGPDSQFDLKITCVMHRAEVRLNMFMAMTPLAQAPLSEAGDTDIQLIPEEKRQQFMMEAKIRHDMGDSTSAKNPELSALLGGASLDSAALAKMQAEAQKAEQNGRR